MNKFLSTLTPFVGAKPLTFVAAFSGLAILLVLPSRHGVADWSGSVNETDQTLPASGSTPVSLEAPEAVVVSAVPATSDSNVSVQQSATQSGERSQPVDLVVSPLTNNRGVEFARATETSSADEFGHASRSGPAAAQIFGSGIGAREGESTPLASGGLAGGPSSGGASAASDGNGGAISEAAPGGRAHDADQSSSNGAAAQATRQAALPADTVPDPSPVMKDPIPLAASPPPAVHNSPSGPADNQVTAPTNSGEANQPPMADNGLPSLGDTGADATGGVASLPMSPGAVSPLAVAGSSDLPTEADVKPAELAPVSRVPDNGRSVVLLAGALLGLWGFHRWHFGSAKRF